MDTLEGRIYREVFHAVDDHRALILDRYPGPDVLRRNTGYALDVLARGQPWAAGGPEFNLAPFLCGSEGTLAIITEAVLNLVTKPTSRLLVCAHFKTLDGAPARHLGGRAPSAGSGRAYRSAYPGTDPRPPRTTP